MIAAAMVCGCSRPSPAPVQFTARIISASHHDPSAYTQGLQLYQGRLFESSGLYQKSSVREVNPATGQVIRHQSLPDHMFAEGLSVHNHELWVLTWREQTAFVLELDTLAILRTHAYEGEGWGLTSDESSLIMSDGTSTLKFIDPTDFSIKRRLSVTENGIPLMNLNELEYVNGSIFANVYLTDRLVQINPANGRVIGYLDLSSLRSHLPQPNQAEALNGIAYDAATGHLLVTGKYWPLIFELAWSGKR